MTPTEDLKFAWQDCIDERPEPDQSPGTLNSVNRLGALRWYSGRTGKVPQNQTEPLKRTRSCRGSRSMSCAVPQRARDMGLPALTPRHKSEPLSERSFCALDVHQPCLGEPLSMLLLRVGLADVKVIDENQIESHRLERGST